MDTNVYMVRWQVAGHKAEQRPYTRKRMAQVYVGMLVKAAVILRTKFEEEPRIQVVEMEVDE